MSNLEWYEHEIKKLQNQNRNQLYQIEALEAHIKALEKELETLRNTGC